MGIRKTLVCEALSKLSIFLRWASGRRDIPQDVDGILGTTKEKNIILMPHLYRLRSPGPKELFLLRKDFEKYRINSVFL